MNSLTFDATKLFLGSLCKRGHDYEGTRQSLRNIRGNYCVECKKLVQQRYQRSEESKQRKLVYQREYRKTKPIPESYKVKAAAYKKKWYQENREEFLAQCKAYRSQPEVTQRNRDKATQWAKNNPERYKARQKAWRESEKGKLLKKAHQNNYRSRKLENHYTQYTKAELQEICDRFDNQCAYCGKFAKLQMDHAVPISLGGADVAGNLLPACKSCNSGKKNRTIEDWYFKQTFFTQSRWKKIKQYLGWKNCNGQLSLF